MAREGQLDSSSAHLRASALSPLAFSMQAAYLSTLLGLALLLGAVASLPAPAEPSPSPRSAMPAASIAFSSSPNGRGLSGTGKVWS